MAVTWYYADGEYTSEADVNAAVVSFQSRLDNNPTDWVLVKEVTHNPDGTWLVNSTLLTDDQINNLDPNRHYNINAVHSGTTFTAVTGVEAVSHVQSIRTEYATWKGANSITKVAIDEYSPTNVDMSSYVE